MPKSKLTVEYIPIEKLKEFKGNPRVHDGTIDRIINSIKAFGFTNPILARRQNRQIIAGHGRYRALKKLGHKTVPVIFLDLDKTDARVYSIFDNKSVEMVDWDLPKLADLFVDFDQLNVDMDLTGFTPGEIENIVVGPEGIDPNAQDDIIPENAKTRAKKGDLWSLDKHRLLCGDATEADNIKRLCGKLKPQLCVTDPPYGVSYDPKWRMEAGVNRSKGRMGRVNNDDVIDWSIVYSLFDVPILYVWHAGKFGDEVAAGLQKQGYEIIAQIVWVKDQYAISRGDYHWRHEPCWYAHKRGQKHNWQGKRDQCTVWEINRVDKNEKAYGRGVQKPLECMARPIINNSRKGDVVCDPFLGSGTTLIACEKLDRVCLGLEIDPHYCNVILKRWEEYTGKTAKLAKRGR